jgi:hypothetical protein
MWCGLDKELPEKESHGDPSEKQYWQESEISELSHLHKTACMRCEKISAKVPHDEMRNEV